MEYFITALLCAISSATLIHTLRIADAARRRALITDDIAGCCESLGFVGCSVICSGVKEIEHIEELLGQEYDRYEVIVTLDAEEYRQEFSEIVSRYRMIRVNCAASEELPTATIRALYRSRQRCFRRLIIIDKAFTTPYDDLDAATSVASYNYLLPAGTHTHLCPKAIEHIAITLSEPRQGEAELFFSKATDSYVFQRDAIIANGGFSPHIIGQIPSSNHLSTYLPLTFSSQQQRYTLATAAVIIALLGLVYIAAGAATTIATISTLAMVAACARYIYRVTAPAKCSFKIMLCYFRKMPTFFRPRKFIIS